jgi:hypothetical protein
MSATTFEYVINFTIAHEGDTPFMYNNWPLKNPNKDVTVGVGHALFSANEAASPDVRRMFTVKATGRPASAEEMVQEYRRVNDLPRTQGNLFSAYRDASPLQMIREEMLSDLRNKLLGYWASRGQEFPNFAAIPAQAQAALMSWNYGLRLRGAPKMCNAIRAGDFVTAAAECRVPGWDGQKNEGHRVLLLNAAAIVASGADPNKLPPPNGPFKPPPREPAPSVGPNWLNGWWKVWDGNTYYYFFGPDGVVQYTKTRPSNVSGPPIRADNIGRYTYPSPNQLVITWNQVPGAEAACRETFYNAVPGCQQMNATSNLYSPLVATRKLS